MRGSQVLLGWAKVPWLLRRAMDPNSEMTTVEVRLNLWHFATQTLAYDVRGDFAAFGCFDGKTAVIYQKVLDEFGSQIADCISTIISASVFTFRDATSVRKWNEIFATQEFGRPSSTKAISTRRSPPRCPRNRAEKVSPIWAGEYPQGYFRKR